MSERDWGTWICKHDDGDRLVGKDEECPACGTHYVLGAGPSPAMKDYLAGRITAAQYYEAVNIALDAELRPGWRKPKNRGHPEGRPRVSD